MTDVLINFVRYCKSYLSEKTDLTEEQAALLVLDPELGPEMDATKDKWLWEDLGSATDPDEFLIPKLFNAPEMKRINQLLERYAKEYSQREANIKSYLRSIGHPYASSSDETIICDECRLEYPSDHFLEGSPICKNCAAENIKADTKNNKDDYIISQPKRESKGYIGLIVLFILYGNLMLRKEKLDYISPMSYFIANLLELGGLVLLFWGYIALRKKMLRSKWFINRKWIASLIAGIALFFVVSNVIVFIQIAFLSK